MPLTQVGGPEITTGTSERASSRPLYSAIVYFLSRYKLLYSTILVLTLVSSVLESLSVAAFFPLFTSLLDQPEDEVGGVLGLIRAISEVLPISDAIISASVLLIILFLVKTVLVLARDILIAYGRAKVLYNAKREIMDRYADAHYQFFLDSKQGTLLYNSLSAPYAVGSLLLKGPQMLASLLKIISVGIVLALILPIGAAALAVVGLAYYAIVHHLSRRVSFSLGVGLANAGSEQTVIANEFLSGIRQIITLRAVRHWTSRFDRQNRTYSELMARQTAWFAVPRPIMEFFGMLMMLGLILALRIFSTESFADVVPRLGVFAVALAQLMPALTAFGRTRMEMMAVLPDAQRAYDTLTQPVPRRTQGHRVLESFQKSITLENVTFAHKGREPLMTDVNLRFEKNQVTAIVGPSGAGKTTIINLILGLFDPTEGRVTVDGIPLQEFRQDSWLSKIGFVSQDPFTYHSSIADNVQFGRKGHTIESIIEANKIANAHGFISEFPQGYDTTVGDRGMKLSGGQQQRIAIARAVLDSPEILIFDEATSSLDSISESVVQEAIDKVSSDRTVIIIAHRLSTIRHADKIIVLDNGRVVEQGTHAELIDRNGHYSRLAASYR